MIDSRLVFQPGQNPFGVGNQLPLEKIFIDIRSELNAFLGKEGAILWRGFDYDFRACLESLNTEFVTYDHGTSPRTSVEPGVMTSTDVNRRYPIPLHAEMSYTSPWPDLVAFTCVDAPDEGGETTIADLRQVTESLAPEVLDSFATGVMNIRYIPPVARWPYPTGWREMYGKESIAKVLEALGETHPLSGSIGSMLKLVNVQPACQHWNDQKIWYNQLIVFHRSYGQEFRHRSLGSLAVGSKLVRWSSHYLRHWYPYECRYGDGREIPDELVHQIRQAHWNHSQKVRWQKRDLLLLNNHFMAHGREPFVGKRKVLAALLRRNSC